MEINKVIVAGKLQKEFEDLCILNEADIICG